MRKTPPSSLGSKVQVLKRNDKSDDNGVIALNAGVVMVDNPYQRILCQIERA